VKQDIALIRIVDVSIFILTMANQRRHARQWKARGWFCRRHACGSQSEGHLV